MQRLISATWSNSQPISASVGGTGHINSASMDEIKTAVQVVFSETTNPRISLILVKQF